MSRAIRKLVELTSQHQHYLLADGEDKNFSSVFREVRRFRSAGTLGRIWECRWAVADFQPDYVHLHSSWAGAYGRLTQLKAKVIYQPHCYKFDDATLNASKKWLFRFAEKMLSFRSDATVVLSPHEKKLTLQLNSKAKCFYVPNVSSCDHLQDTTASIATEGGARRVLMIGRICAQKDPIFFGEVAKLAALSPILSSWIFRWIGDGEPELREILKSGGVEIAGWKETDELVAELDAGDYYVHSAAYEGFPISILDAAARALPIIAREIDALAGSDIYQVASPRDVVDALEQSEMSSAFHTMLIGRSKLLVGSMNEENQEKAWQELYSPSGAVAT